MLIKNLVMQKQLRIISRSRLALCPLSHCQFQLCHLWRSVVICAGCQFSIVQLLGFVPFIWLPLVGSFSFILLAGVAFQHFLFRGCFFIFLPISFDDE
jgi:hypothetical protein